MPCFKGLLLILVLVAGSFMLGHFALHAQLASNNLVIDRFPAKVDNSWEYRNTFYYVIFDPASGDSIDVYLGVDSLHSEFDKIDTLRGWECYRYSSQLFHDGNTYSGTVWYAHPDTAFLEVAYTAPLSGPPWVSSRKPKLEFKEKYFTSIDELKLYLYQIRNPCFPSDSSETTFWDPPKKLFVFPLKIETKWISMTDPWKEEREVAKEESINVPAGDFFTLKIEMRPDYPGLHLYQWISDLGIIKDSAYADEIVLLDYSNGQIIGTGRGYDKYELVGYRTTAVEDENSENEQPPDFSLSQNYPNPFNPLTVIRFSLSADHHAIITLKVYDVLGQKVSTLVNEPKRTGNYEVTWDGKNDSGEEVASGIYFYKLSAGEFSETKKMVLLR